MVEVDAFDPIHVSAVEEIVKLLMLWWDDRGNGYIRVRLGWDKEGNGYPRISWYHSW